MMRPCKSAKGLPIHLEVLEMNSCVRLCAVRATFFVLLCALAIPSRANAQISVLSTTPNNAAQGTINLNVTVGGKGFKNGAKAQWFVTGTTNPGGVTVNSTAFVNSTTLNANITVSSMAVLGNFDVQVTNSDGRTGKGTELFAVVGNGNKQTTLRVAGLKLRAESIRWHLANRYGYTSVPFEA